MADTIPAIPRRSALEGHYAPGTFGAHQNAPGVTLTERRGLAIVHVDAWADEARACAKALKEACGVAPSAKQVMAAEADGTAVLWVGPNRWLVTEKERRDLFAALSAKIGPDMAALTDQGHSRVCWRLEGLAVRDLLAKGSTIDFGRAQFRPGACVGTLLGHFTVTLHCHGEDAVDIYAARSFAVDLHEWLVEASLDLGLRIADPI